MKDEKYISLDDVCEILKRHSAYTSKIAEEINEKAISAVATGYLQDWYIASVSESDNPVWTEKHIYELARDFALLPREDDYFKGNGYAKRFEEGQDNVNT